MYVLRYMTLDDIPAVVDIDRASFPSSWSPRSYVFEIAENHSSHMVVLESDGAEMPDGGRAIIGYAGMWLIAGEAHISTIAVRPDQRGKRLGEVLLAGLISRAIMLGGEYAVLEVRVSNHKALRLYEKYEFKITYRRKNYYRDTNEDGYIMNLAPLDADYLARFRERVRQLNARVVYMNFLVQSNPKGKPL